MMRRRFAAAILITGLAGMLSALPCFSFTVMDKTGKEVEISPPVGRVILLSLYELIPVLDLWDRVVGINRWALDNELLKRHPQLAGIPAVGTGEAVNIEAVIALEPELVITWSYKPEVAEFLSRKGLKTLSVYPESLDELYRAIEMCGVIFHVEDRAGSRTTHEGDVRKRSFEGFGHPRRSEAQGPVDLAETDQGLRKHRHPA